jgi:hypothetical protein
MVEHEVASAKTSGGQEVRSAQWGAGEKASKYDRTVRLCPGEASALFSPSITAAGCRGDPNSGGDKRRPEAGHRFGQAERHVRLHQRRLKRRRLDPERSLWIGKQLPSSLVLRGLRSVPGGRAIRVEVGLDFGVRAPASCVDPRLPDELCQRSRPTRTHYWGRRGLARIPNALTSECEARLPPPPEPRPQEDRAGGSSVSSAATEYGRQNGITVIDGGCPLMFGPTADFGHKIMRVALAGRVPKQV